MKEQLTSNNVRIDYLPCINYAISSTGWKYMNSMVLENDDDTDWHDISITLSGEFLKTSECVIGLVPKGSAVDVNDIFITPDIDKLRTMSERVETQFKVAIVCAESEVYSSTHDISILPFDQWPGTGVMPEILSVFVTPNAASLAAVRLQAARHLERLTGSSSLDDYQTKDPNRARAMVASVYDAFHQEGLVYITPPANFEQSGQRVRMCDQLLNQKQGTCLDLSIAFASCLESIGLHPLLFLIKGHAFVGCWLVDKYYPQPLCDDVSFISKSMADGISEIVVVEATSLTQSSITFEQAVKLAEEHINVNPNLFQMAVDVYRCRLHGLRPLPTDLSEAKVLEGVGDSAVSKDIKEMHQYDLTGNDNRQITRQQIWERKLLDFSLRNNLLNMRVGKNIVPLLSFGIDQLEDIIQNKEDLSILAWPSEKKASAGSDGIYDSRVHADMEALVMEGLKHQNVYSYLSDTDLPTALKGLVRSSRTALEESGSNTLYIVLGLLKWYENEKSIKPRYAPLLLEPVDLVRKSGNSYVLRMRDEDITFNTTLVEMMRQQYEVKFQGVNPLPEDESGIDVRKTLSIVRATIKDHPRWDVLEESLLGLFSFSKFVMWNDIHNNSEKMCENPVIKSLLQNRLVDIDPGDPTDTRQQDMKVNPSSYAIPVDVDSSQLEAVIESGEGRSFILYGPPGTGKSQTITNMIANALLHDRRVLFVAEKMAALEVVQKRLSKVGLGPFCLEMHSNKMTKSHLLNQLKSTLDLTRVKSPEQYEQESKNLFEQRKHLIKYVELLHTKQPSGLSLYDYITRYLMTEGEEALPPSQSFLDGIDAQRIDEVVSKIKELEAVFHVTGHPKDSQLKGLLITEMSFEMEQKANSWLQQLSRQVPNARTALRALSQSNGISIPEDIGGLSWAERFYDAVSDIPVINSRLLRAATTESEQAKWQDYLSTCEQLSTLRATIQKTYSPEVLKLDVNRLKNEWQQASDKWAVSKFFAQKGIIKELKAYCATISNDDVPVLLQNLEQYHSLESSLAPCSEEAKDLFGTLATLGGEHWKEMKDSLLKAKDIQSMLKETNTPGAYIPELNKNATLSIDMTAIRQAKALFSGAENGVSIAPEVTLDEMVQRIPAWLINLGKSRDWAQWCVRRKELVDLHLNNVVSYIENGHEVEAATQAMLRGLYKRLAMDIIDHDETLKIFNGMIFEDAIAKYRTMAKEYQDLTKRALYCKLAARVPSQTIEAAQSSEIGKLKRHIANGGRGTSIRNIIDQVPTLLPRLCPCILMSPISVAQFIDLNQDKFDLVVFDEASQMPTSEAVGAIARGKSLIVVGDPKQMPPTSFFSTTSVDESEADIDDMESILDDCITLSFPEHYLTWHYRSRHESLIAFSNSNYYDGRLYTFPSADDRSSKVSFVKVEGTYDMGKSRSNREEAKAIVEEVKRRLNDPKLQKNSIGIVSFSKAQQDLIEDILTEELAKQPKLERLAYDCEEPIFIKNLENVQGDERDVILFSVGYGPDSRGRVSMNFGPLNNVGGERRLNVAVSRARTEMMVFSTMEPEQIDLNRSRARGVEGLKRFLEFAKNGRMPVASSQMQQDTDTALVDSIAKELRLHGYEVDTRVGRSRFKIDIAVSDPSNSENYILGIICDGRNYHETPTERDREICQPGVLQGLGWNLMRVWSIDWFLNPERVTDRILERLEQITSKRENAAPEQFKSAPKVEKPKAAPVVDAGIPFKVSAEDIITEEQNDKEASYEKMELSNQKKFDSPENLSLARRQIMVDIARIIQQEQPVARSTIRKRIMESYNQARTSDRLEHLLDKGTEKSYVDPSSMPDNPVFWVSESDSRDYALYRKAEGRDNIDIPPCEVCNAIKEVLRQQISVSDTELMRIVSHLFGFPRRTPRFDNIITHSIDYMAALGIVQRKGDMVVME